MQNQDSIPPMQSNDRKETLTDALLDIAKSHYETLTGVPSMRVEDDEIYTEGKKHRSPPANFKE